MTIVNGEKRYGLIEKYITVTGEIWIKTPEADTLTCPQAPAIETLF